jgi:hypothetical protein
VTSIQEDITVMTETNREIEKELEDSLAQVCGKGLELHDNSPIEHTPLTSSVYAYLDFQSEEKVKTLEKDVMRAKDALEDAKTQSATLKTEVGPPSQQRFHW